MMPIFEHVLIIDDDPVVTSILNEYFFKRDVPFRTIANDGEKARDAYLRADGEIDLITCDLNMPDFDGIEFLDFLQRHESRVPLIILTGAQKLISDSAKLLAHSYGLHLIRLLRKPVAITELDEAIEIITNSSRNTRSEMIKRDKSSTSRRTD